MKQLLTTFTLITAAGAWSSAARADELPTGLVNQDPASAGATDVGGGGFGEATKPDEDKDATQAEISAGALVTSGNSRQMALTSAGKFRLRRSAHQFSTQAAGNLARAAAPGTDAGMETTVENLQGRVRYDYFFSSAFSGFLGVVGRRDRFQGLNLRLNVDPGVAYYAIDEAQQQFWFELGYDLQHDIRRDEALAVALADGEVLAKTETRHSGRAFIGYENKLNERVTGSTGLEYLQSVQDSSKWRMNWDAAITSNIAGKFSTAITFSLRYDHEPLPGIQKTDILTSFNLVYGLL